MGVGRFGIGALRTLSSGWAFAGQGPFSGSRSTGGALCVTLPPEALKGGLLPGSPML